MKTKTAGIRELKTHLSGYLKDVKEGGEILISEHGRAIARIVPVGGPEGNDAVRAALIKLSHAGKILLPAAYEPPASPKFRKKMKGAPFSDAVLEDRR